MKKLLYCFLFFPVLLSAQINESDTLKFKASLSVSGFWQSGNVDTWIFRANSNLSVKPWEKWVFKTQNSYVYQAFGQEKADEDILSLNFLYFNPEQRIYPLVLGFFSTSFRREIDVRYLVGAGATFKVLDQELHWLKFSLTIEYEKTSFDRATFNRSEFNGSPTINTLRGTFWANGKYHFFKKKVILSHESYFQPSLQQRNNFRWQIDVGLETPIWKFLNFRISYLHTFESIVVEDQQQQDRFLTFGFTLKNF